MRRLAVLGCLGLLVLLLGATAGRGFGAETSAPPASLAEVDVEVATASTIEGRLATPHGETLPDSLGLTLLTSAKERSGVEADGAQLECPVRGDRWRCRVPAGLLDMRLRARGYLSEYRWGIEAQPGAVVDLGVLRLRHGASLTGWVETVDGQPIQACRVELDLPAMVPERSEREAKSPLRKLNAGVLDNGFFEFQGLAVGSYAVSVRQPGYATATVYPIEVEENAETAIPEPILLERLVELTVTVDPPRDFEGRSWTVRAQARSPVDDRTTDFRLEELSTTGMFRSAGLAPVSYRVVVRDVGSQQLATEEFLLSSQSDTLDIRIRLLDLQGSVRLGDQPLGNATIGLMSRDGSVQLEARSDDFGEFRGQIPAGHEWKAQVWAEQPPVDAVLQKVELVEGESEATLVIRLPDNELRGLVVDEHGQGVRAFVEYYNFTRSAHSSLRTDASGGFLVHGLPSGEFIFSATSAATGASSEDVKVALGESGSAATVRLVVRDKKTLTGIVTSASGPIARAQVLGLPKRSDGSLDSLDIPQTTTGADGAFSLEIPTATAGMALVIMARGRILDTASLILPAQEPVVLRVADSAGVIRLRWPRPLDVGDPRLAKPMLSVRGVDLDMALLRWWAVQHGVTAESPATEITIPNLAPGAYRACFPEPGETLAEWIAERRQSCVDGELPVGGELVLSAP